MNKLRKLYALLAPNSKCNNKQKKNKKNKNNLFIKQPLEVNEKFMVSLNEFGFYFSF